jgi:phenol hydroxylase P0 protein
LDAGLTLAAFDPSLKFVRMIAVRSNGLVEFQFAVGEPELFAELILPQTAFEEFCANNQVTMLSDEVARPDAPADAREWDWTLRQATHQRFR